MNRHNVNINRNISKWLTSVRQETVAMQEQKRLVTLLKNLNVHIQRQLGIAPVTFALITEREVKNNNNDSINVAACLNRFQNTGPAGPWRQAANE